MTQHRQGFGHKGLTGANGIPLGLHIKDSALHHEAEQHRVNLPLSASVKRPSFIHKLSASEKEDLYKLFVDGFDFFSIQEFFRLTYPRSILDYLSKEEEAELKILLAANLSSEAIGELFAPDKSSTHEKGSAVPVSSVFDRIQQDLAAKSVTVDKVNMPTGRVSVFDRLDRPVLQRNVTAQEGKQSVFERLEWPNTSARPGPQVFGPAAPSHPWRRLHCPRCLLFGHSRQGCHNKI